VGVEEVGLQRAEAAGEGEGGEGLEDGFEAGAEAVEVAGAEGVEFGAG
jgi:hypothetical protein